MNISRRVKENQYFFAILLLFFVSYASISVVFGFLNFDVFQSDVKGYWIDTVNIKTPFHPFHVPGYPFLLAVLRFFTGGILSPTIYLRTISFISFSLALTLVFKIGKIYSDNEKYAFLSACLFLLWPMVGVPYVVYPLADSLSLFVFLLGIFFFLKKKYLLGALVWAFALFVHKAFWVYIAVGFLLFAWQSWSVLRMRIFIYGAVIFVPLLVFTLLGSFHHGSLTWIISSNLSVELNPRTQLPFLDGLLGTFLRPGVSSLVKGGLLIIQFVLAVFLLVVTFQKKYTGWEWGMSISIATLILMIVLNQYEIWASLRFGRLLVVPLSVYLSSKPINLQPSLEKIFAILLAVILLASQLFYAWYLTIYFGA